MAEQQLFSFFSSDAGDLYKADIFRALALPKNYVIPFRYRVENIDPSLRDKYDELKGKKGCIFFVSGNTDQSIEPSKRPHQFFSVREVVVKDWYFDKENTRRVYFYLELGNFVNYKISTVEAAQLPTTDIYVSQIRVDHAPNEHSWTDRIKAIGSFFPDQLFYKIGSIKKGNKLLKPAYNSHGANSSYALNDESEFQCEMQFFDNGAGKSVLLTETLFEALNVEIPKRYIVGTESDRLIFGIQTNSLARRRESATVRFYQEEKSEVYRVDLGITVVRSKWKPFYFGFFTSLAALGFVLGQMAPKMPADIPQLTWLNGLLGGAAVICVGIGAGFLYQLFNKK